MTILASLAIPLVGALAILLAARINDNLRETMQVIVDFTALETAGLNNLPVTIAKYKIWLTKGYYNKKKRNLTLQQT